MVAFLLKLTITSSSFFHFDIVSAGVTLPSSSSSDIAVCPGESARYGDHKCNHDRTHRVCAQLLDSSDSSDGKPRSWGDAGDFWQITGQKSFQWDDQIRANHGDSWCICMWATANLIEKVGCDNVHLRCDATDVDYVMSKYSDGGVGLAGAKECLAKKCGFTAGSFKSESKSESKKPKSKSKSSDFFGNLFI